MNCRIPKTPKTIFVLLVLFLFLPATPLHAETIEVVGTGDGMTVLRSIAKAFNETHPGTRVVIPDSIGSSGGIKAVGNGSRKIGRVARNIKEKEQSLGLTYLPIAKFPVVFFVNESVGISHLDAKQIVKIYSGEIRNWADVGGKVGKIRVVRREKGDSSLRNLRATFPGFKDVVILKQSKTAVKTQENIEIVENTRGAIGFAPYSDVITKRVKALSIDGKSPADADYPSFGTLALIFKESNRKGPIDVFIRFASDTKCKQAIMAANAIPYE